MARAARDEEFSEYVVQRRTQLRRVAYLLCGDVHQAEDLGPGWSWSRQPRPAEQRAGAPDWGAVR